MLFDKHLRRDEEAWEVVELKDVSPISMWDDDEGLWRPNVKPSCLHLTICRPRYRLRPQQDDHFQVCLRPPRGCRPTGSSPLCPAAASAERSPAEVQHLTIRGVHLFCADSSHKSLIPIPRWRCTLMRRGKQYRVEVVYSGRPARAMGKVGLLPQPPFMGMLDQYQHQFKRYQDPPRRRLFRTWSPRSFIMA